MNRRPYILVARERARFQATQSCAVTADAIAHAYAYSTFADKATKATLADKIDGVA